jgi:hypothetical protein
MDLSEVERTLRMTDIAIADADDRVRRQAELVELLLQARGDAIPAIGLLVILRQSRQLMIERRCYLLDQIIRLQDPLCDGPICGVYDPD